MGEFAQKRLIRKLDLELFLSKIAPQPTPQVRLEQYTISEQIASTMLYIAAYSNDDIVGKSVLDLGCGTGDIAAITGHFDTVVMNPPFGVQHREADRSFLVKALEVSNTVYSLHNHPEVDERLIKMLKLSGGTMQVQPSSFLERFIAKRDGQVKAVYSMLMSIPKMFDFHRKLKHDFVVDLYIIQKCETYPG
jgi:predicted RNA methylase